MGGEATLKNRSGGPSGMREEHHKGWLVEARREEEAEEKAVEGAATAI